MPLILHSHVTPTTVYHIEGDGPLFYLIPGNPGLSEFYGLYLETLKAAQPSLELLCPSHIGFDTLAVKSFGIVPGHVSYTLDDQIEHKISLLRDWVKRQGGRGPRDVIMCGHSVGAWMVQRVAMAFKDDPNVNIKMVGLLTPTLADIAKSGRGAKLMKVQYVTSDPGYYLARVSQLLNWTLSKSVLKQVVSYVMGNPPEESLDAAVSLVTKPRIVQQALDLAKEEMLRIGSDLEESDIKGFWNKSSGYRIWAFYAAQDNWVLPETRDAVVQRYGHEQHIDIDMQTDINDPNQIAHAFCVSHYKEVAAMTARQIAKL